MWTESRRRDVAERWRGRLAVVTPDAHKAYGLASTLPGLRVLSATSADERPAPALLAAFETVGAELQVVEVEGERFTTRGLLEAPAATRWLERWGAPAVVVFRPDADTGRRLTALGCRLVGADPGVARKLENKRAFRLACRQAGLPVVETLELRWPPREQNQSVWGRFAGGSVIVQTARGYAGRRTWLWRVGEGLPDVPDHVRGRPVLLAPLLEGPTWTVNAVVGPDGVRCGPPMRQATGEARLTALPLSSCGVALAPPGAEAVAQELAGLAHAVGAMAAEAGFIGFFGIDAVGEPGRLQLIEMNARLTATLTIATLAELAAGARPLLLDHVHHCLGAPLEPAPDVASAGVSGGHLLVRETAGWRAEVGDLGTYEPSGGAFERRSDSAGWPPAGQVAVWPAGPAWGTPSEDRARLLFSEAMMGPDGGFTPFVEHTLGAVVVPAGAAPTS